MKTYRLLSAAGACVLLLFAIPSLAADPASLPQPDQNFWDGLQEVGPQSDKTKAIADLKARMKARAGRIKGYFIEDKHAEWMLPLSKKAYEIHKLRQDGRLPNETAKQRQLIVELKTLIQARKDKQDKSAVESKMVSDEGLMNINRFIALETAYLIQAEFASKKSASADTQRAVERTTESLQRMPSMLQSPVSCEKLFI